MPSAELRVPCDVGYVGLVRLVVTQAARQAGMADERVEDLKIAITEALGSAVRAQAEDPGEAQVRLSFGRIEDAFEVIVAGLDERPDSASPDADRSVPSHDLGITLIRGLADNVSFQPNGEGLQLRFTVGLDAAE